MGVQRWLDEDVLTAARRRIRSIYERFDNVVVSFSGGKDSLTVLHLCHEIGAEFGREVVDVLFYDEELVPPAVIMFVAETATLPWVRMRWMAFPLRSDKSLLGMTTEYVQWDPEREWVRPIPTQAIRPRKSEEGQVWTQYTLTPRALEDMEGSICVVTGIRAAEALMRLRAILAKPHETYLCDPPVGHHRLARPIYDWMQHDVFKYIGEVGARYCLYYDQQLWGRMELRVSTPLHSENSPRIHLLRTVDPEFYDRVLRVFPEMAAQDRWFRALDRTAEFERFKAMGPRGLRAFIMEKVDASRRPLALRRLGNLLQRRQNAPDYYPLDHLLRYFMSGTFKRDCLPLNKRQAAAAKRARGET